MNFFKGNIWVLEFILKQTFSSIKLKKEQSLFSNQIILPDLLVSESIKEKNNCITKLLCVWCNYFVYVTLQSYITCVNIYLFIVMQMKYVKKRCLRTPAHQTWYRCQSVRFGRWSPECRTLRLYVWTVWLTQGN